MLEGERPIVSIVTIAYNCSDTIEKTIKSVIGQTYSNIEYVIIDGGSCDGTLEIIQKYSEYISILVSEQDNGISDAFNKGIRLSSGESIMLLNAGDVLISENIINDMIGLISKNDIVTGFSTCKGAFLPPIMMSNDDPIYKKSKISHQATFVKRKVYDTIGEYDIQYKLRMDYDYWIRCLKYYKFLFVNKVIVIYEGGGVSSRNPFRYYAEECLVNLRHTDKMYFIISFLRMSFMYCKYLAGCIIRTITSVRR